MVVHGYLCLSIATLTVLGTHSFQACALTPCEVAFLDNISDYNF